MSLSLLFLAILPGAVRAQTADPPSQIHLSCGATPSHVVVMWRTRAATATHTVEYGLTPALGTAAAGTAVPAPNGAAGYIHTVALPNLRLDALYYYRCGDAQGGWSEIHTFRTGPGSGPLVVAAFGDQGTSSHASQVAHTVAGSAPHLVLHLGDLSYAVEVGGGPDIWDRWFELNERFAARAFLMPTLGNHETDGNDLATYLGRFTLPEEERWYSFTAGAAVFLSIDCMSSVAPGSPQYQWLAARLSDSLSNPAIRWKIVTTHYAPFTSSSDHPEHGAAIRQHLAPLFDAYHVDLVLSGHEHLYERTYPLTADATIADTSAATYANPGGTVYIVSGTGGHGLADFAAPAPAWSAIRYQRYGFTRLELSRDTLAVSFVSADGAVLDSWSIAKSASDTTPPTIAITAPLSDQPQRLGSLTIAALARDNHGVARVDFLVDGRFLSADTSAPFEAVWEATSGTHTITAIAYDTAGNSGTAAVSFSGATGDPSRWIARSSLWKFHDRGVDLGAGWRAPEYDDGAWSAGAGPLGYGETYIATPVSFGSDPNQKRITTYFRRVFEAPFINPERLVLRVMHDDGFVAYLNGTELRRHRMPSGPIAYSTRAYWNEAGGAYSEHDVTPAAPLLRPGTNTLAVEVHQDSASSSDLVFDLELEATPPAGVDVQPPSVVLLSPSEGASLQGRVTLRATASDDIGVARVEFLVDGTPVASDVDAPYEAIWDASAAPAGVHILRARASDAAGHSAESPEISVRVEGAADSTPPAIPTLIAPGAGAATGTLPTFDWSDVSDPSGVTYLLQVDDDALFASPLLDASGIGSSRYASAPFSPGTYVWRVRAVDGAGNSGLWSAAWTFSVVGSETPVARRSAWRYHDLGIDLQTAWRAAGYDDRAWPTGSGPLGYGETYLGTRISYGPSSGAKHPTAYFRRAFAISDPSSVSRLTLGLMYDDGCVVYLNGTEIARPRMPAGAIAYATRAQWHEAENSYETFDITAHRALLREGENVLAAEVHQDSASSSDLVFDAELTAWR